MRLNSPWASTAESNWLYNSYDDLEQEYEEENHKVERRITPEGFIDGPVPAYEAERGEENEVEYWEAERREPLTGEHEWHGTDYI